MNQGQDMQPSGDIAFHEEQRFWRGFVVVTIAILVTVAAIQAYAIMEQLISRGSLGQGMPTDVLAALLGAVIALAVAGVLAAARLVIDVRPEGLYIQFVPFHFRPKRIDLSHVVSVKAVTYRPLVEYGGWGIRWAPFGGRAYNVRGNRSVRLDFDSRRHLLLGSQRPEELAEAIERLRRRESEGRQSASK